MSPSFLSSLLIAVLAAFAQGAINIPLGSCTNFAVEAGTAVTFAGTVTTIATGDVGVSPGTSIGGNVVLGTGSIQSQSTLSISCAKDLDIAYLAASEAVPTTVLSLVPNSMLPTADLSGLTLGPGVYSSVGAIIVSATTVTLDGKGDSSAQFVFQAATNIVTSPSTSFILLNGAQAANVYWVAGTNVILGHASSFVGTILAGTAVVFDTNAVLSGRALAHTAVSFAGLGTVSLPASGQMLMSAFVPIKSRSINNLRSKMAVTSSPQPINLGGCADYAVIAGSSAAFNGLNTVVTSGNVGVTPGTSVTGTYQLQDGSVEVNSTGANQCMADRTTAYNAAAAAVCPTANIVNELGGLTLAAGVYCTSGGRMSVSAGTVTLDAAGDSSAVWIFQTPSALYTAPNTQFLLLNGAQANNIFWKVGSSASLGYSSTFAGTILAYASIAVNENAVVSGRALAGAAVTFASADVIAVPASL